MCVQVLKQFRLCFPGKDRSDHFWVDFLEKDYSFTVSVLNHIFDTLHAKKNLPVLGWRKKNPIVLSECRTSPHWESRFGFVWKLNTSFEDLSALWFLKSECEHSAFWRLCKPNGSLPNPWLFVLILEVRICGIKWRVPRCRQATARSPSVPLWAPGSSWPEAIMVRTLGLCLTQTRSEQM